MKKYILFIALFQLVAFSIFAQRKYLPLVEEGKYWIMKVYNDHEPAPQAINGFMYAFEGDTLINNIEYKKLYKYYLAGGHHCQYPPCFTFDVPYRQLDKNLTAFFREDTVSKQVFYLPYQVNISGSNLCDSSECLIFDFALDKGDTLNDYIYELTISPDSSLTGTVDTLDVRINMTDKTKTYRRALGYWGRYPFFYVWIYEGIGLELSGLFVSGIWKVDNAAYLHDYCEGSLENCNIISSNKNIFSEEEIKIYPNPTDDFITIELKNKIDKIEIYNLDGSKVLINNNNTEKIGVSRLNPGLKLIKIIDNKGGVYTKTFYKL